MRVSNSPTSCHISCPALACRQASKSRASLIQLRSRHLRSPSARLLLLLLHSVARRSRLHRRQALSRPAWDQNPQQGSLRVLSLHM